MLGSRQALGVKQDTWLSGILGIPAYYVTGPAELLDLRDLPSGKAFITAKAAVEDVPGLLHLQNLGFRLIDTNVQLARPVSPMKPGSASVRFARPEDAAAVREVAHNSFVHNRFHRDPKVSNEMASRIKSEWAGNYFKGQRGDWMVVAEDERGRVQGFLQLLRLEDDAVLIDLVAVAAGQRGKGLARSMTAYAATECLGRPAAMKVGTQIANIESMALYTRLGFHITSASYVFHLHQEVD